MYHVDKSTLVRSCICLRTILLFSLNLFFPCIPFPPPAPLARPPAPSQGGSAVPRPGWEKRVLRYRSETPFSQTSLSRKPDLKGGSGAKNAPLPWQAKSPNRQQRVTPPSLPDTLLPDLTSPQARSQGRQRRKERAPAMTFLSFSPYRTHPPTPPPLMLTASPIVTV